MPDGVVEIQMPQMGESVTEGVVLEWHKAEGEFVEEGETVVEVSTDKVDAEVPAPASGVIQKIMAQVDDTVAVGQALAQLDPNGSGNGATAPTEPAAGEQPGPGLTAEATGEGDADLGEEPPAAEGVPSGETIVVAMPEMGESVTEGTVLEWHVAEGDQVEEGATVIEVSTDKVDAEVPAPSSGTITKLLVQPDDVVAVGQPLAEMSAGAAPAGAKPSGDGLPASDPAAPGRAAEEAVGDGSGRASPVARRMAAERGIDIGTIQGTGSGGKVVKADVEAAGDGKGAAVPATAAAGEEKPLRGPAAMLAKAMNESRAIPTATSFRTVPVDVLDAKRKALNGVAEGPRDEALVHASGRLGHRQGRGGVPGDGRAPSSSEMESRSSSSPGG